MTRPIEPDSYTQRAKKLGISVHTLMEHEDPEYKAMRLAKNREAYRRNKEVWKARTQNNYYKKKYALE